MTVLHCPQCNEPLDQQEQRYTRRNQSLVGSVTMLTCRNEACEAYGRTCTEKSILDPQQLEAWEFIPKFDLYSGEQLQEACRA